MATEAADALILMLPKTLTWATPGDEVNRAAALHLNRLRQDFQLVLDDLVPEPSETPADDSGVLQLALAALPQQAVDRILLRPDIGGLLPGVPSRNCALLRRVADILASQAELEEFDQPIARDFTLESTRTHRAANDGTPLEGESCDTIEFHFSDDDSALERPGGPPAIDSVIAIRSQSRADVCLALNEALAYVRETRPSLADFLTRCIRQLVVRHSPGPKFSSFTSSSFIGRITLINPQRVGLLMLAEAILHEAIHSYLYMLEPIPLWGFKTPAVNPESTVRSPWTQRELPLYAYVHACFVWYGLFFFWSRRAARTRLEEQEVLKQLAFAGAGFRLGDLTQLIEGRDRETIREPVLWAIAAMQNNVLRVAGAENS